MGNMFICGDPDPQAIQLFMILGMADRSPQSNGRFSELLIDYKSHLEYMISEAKYAKQTFGPVTVQVIPCSKDTINQQTQNQKPWKTVKLVLRSEPQQMSQPTLQSSKQNENFYEGWIIYSKAYYCGQMVKGVAHGIGTLYFYCHQFYEVTGLWQDDALKKGQIYKLQSMEEGSQKIKQFQLVLQNGEREAVLRVDGKFQYRGSIKIKGSKSVNQILTGQGSIKYSNNDQYRGELLNGLYTNKGLFIYASDEQLTYQGNFKFGLRQGRGIISMQLNGEKCNIYMDFESGVPVGGGFLKLQENKASYLIEIQGQEIIIGKRLSEVQS